MRESSTRTPPARAAILFAVLACGITWVATVPEALRRFHVVEFQVPQWAYAVGLFGPALAAVMVTLATERVKGLRRLGETLLPRGPLAWYGLALLLPFLTLGIVAGLMAFSEATVPSREAWRMAFAQTFWLLPLFLREELGWRGYLLPLLLRTMTPLRATVWTTLAWVGWHIPQYVANAPLEYAVLMLVLAAPISILFTLLYLRTRSVLPCLLFHSAIDCGSAHLLFFAYRHDYLVALALWAALLCLVAVPAVRSLGPSRPELPSTPA